MSSPFGCQRSDMIREKRKRVDQLTQMIAWENGELDEGETIALFQALTDSGLVWQLQGVYGRTAAALMDEGLIK